MKNLIVTGALLLSTTVSAAVVEVKTTKKNTFVLEREDSRSKEYKNIKFTTVESQIAVVTKDDGTTEVIGDTTANPASKTTSDANAVSFTFTGDLEVGSLNIQSTAKVDFMSMLDQEVRDNNSYAQTLLYEALIRPLVLADLQSLIDANTMVSDRGVVTIKVDEDLDADVDTRFFSRNSIDELTVSESEMDKVLNPSIEKKAQLDAMFITTSSLLKGQFVTGIKVEKIKSSPLKCEGKRNNLTCAYTTQTVVSVEI